MKHLITLLLLCSASYAQTFRTVTADTNNVIRTNFTLGAAQVSGAFAISNVTGLQSALDGKLATNGDAFSLTNFPASILQTNSSLSSFPAGLLRTNGDGSGLTNLPNADLGNATGVLPLANGGTGQTNAALAIEALLPAYTNNADKILALNSNATSLIWTTNAGGGGGLTNVDLASTNVTGILPVNRGGLGATNLGGIAGSILTVQNGIVFGASASHTGNGVAIGNATNSGTGTSGGVSIGAGANGNSDSTSIGRLANSLSGGVAIGATATNTGGGSAVGFAARVTGGGAAIGQYAFAADGGAIGLGAVASNSSFAGGQQARAHAANSIQLGSGTNTTANSIQLLGAGTIDTNEWSRLAALSTYPTTNISVVGTNNTNTLVFSNGILTSVTTP